MTIEQCPCGSGKNYSECCEPIIKQQTFAESPEALMRSRYTAYAKREVLWLRDSLEESQRKDFSEKGARQWSEQAEWLGLKIIRSEADKEKGKGIVEFIAKYKQNSVIREHRELSEFVCKDGKWFLTEGQMVKSEPIVKKPTANRNDPCPCGSGKKYKKCCGF